MARERFSKSKLLFILVGLILFLLFSFITTNGKSAAGTFFCKAQEHVSWQNGKVTEGNYRSGPGKYEEISAGEVQHVKVLRPSVVGEADGMITPGDAVKLNLSLLVPSSFEEITIQFYSTSGLVEGFKEREVKINAGSGSKISVSNSLYLARGSDELGELYRRGRTKLSFKGSILLVYRLQRKGRTYYGSDLTGPTQTGSPAEAVYPDFAEISSRYLKDPPEGKDRFYLEGDPDFANLNDPNVRELAVAAAVHEKGYFPDEPAEVAHSVYEFVAETLEPDSWSEEEVFTSAEIARWWKDGKLGPEEDYVRPHRRYVTSSTEPPGYICIEHAYLFTSLLRSLGIPSREINLGLATHLRETEDGYELGYYCQEAAAQAYYYGNWHLFDPFLEYTSFQGYKEEFWSYVAWYAWNRRSKHDGGEEIGIDGGYGHNFMLDDSGSGIPQSRNHWKRLHSGTKPGIVVSLPEGQTGFRLRVESRDGKIAGFNNSTQEGSRIPGTLFYGSRSIPGIGNATNRYPDIIFVPRDEVEGLKLKVVRQPGNRLLGHEERKSGSKFCLLILRKIAGKRAPTFIKRVGTLSPGDSETYELKVRPDGELKVNELD